jgi:pyruvate kinase
MTLPENKTKIVCTIGPVSESRPMLERLMDAGMNVARLNFSHGDFQSHAARIRALKQAQENTGKKVAIMADLPGPKMRIREFVEEPVELEHNDEFILTTRDLTGDSSRVSVTFDGLPLAVKPGDTLFLNDGLVILEVKRVEERDVICRVSVGGELWSRKGLNLPGIALGIGAFTERDRECLKFALEHGVDAISQSFVVGPKDIEDVRMAASEMGYSPFIIAKIERSDALPAIDDIIAVSDGIMIARGDLGVETPIERMAVVQKQLTQKANFLGKPVITATQMLESMTEHRRPTRAEATDVANSILDGTDCVMLSGESAVGKYPVEAVRMLAKIAASTEPERKRPKLEGRIGPTGKKGPLNITDLIARSVAITVENFAPALVLAPTRSGNSARSLSRFRLPVWIVSVSPLEATCRQLMFSYGIHPIHMDDDPEDWVKFSRDFIRTHHLSGGLVALSQGPSPKNPRANHSIEIIDLERLDNLDNSGN